ncbi:dipeptidase [Melioribacteraceae bacterium 4301-Me]|uniref:dipeptidase n=1 Tax=Pyranulibacter aquaticus TaxID=3163344 RepID=UPI0035999B53
MEKIALLLAFFLSYYINQSGDKLKERANKIAHKYILIDTHIDAPLLLYEKWTDITKKNDDRNFDYVKAKEGGLDAPFMSIYTPANYENNGAKKYADKLISLVYNVVQDNTDKFAFAFSYKDIIKNFNQGKISLPMGMENGSPIEGDLKNLEYFYSKGIRYITLAHSKSNHICDSSYDPNKKWNGLSPFGVLVVKEMNRLGIMVDVSHISDSAFYQVLRVTQAPVIASHSSCRYFTPGWERNMSDDMIKALAKNGGVIQINFGSDFLKDEILKKEEAGKKQIKEYLNEHKLNEDSKEAESYKEKFWKENPMGFADVKDVADHIDHVVKLVGIDYVGIGSDFDGLGDTLPVGLKDVSQYPNLIYELLKRGYSEKDIQKIMSGNLLRVWQKVEETAKKIQQSRN